MLLLNVRLVKKKKQKVQQVLWKQILVGNGHLYRHLSGTIIKKLESRELTPGEEGAHRPEKEGNEQIRIAKRIAEAEQ